MLATSENIVIRIVPPIRVGVPVCRLLGFSDAVSLSENETRCMYVQFFPVIQYPSLSSSHAMPFMTSFRSPDVPEGSSDRSTVEIISPLDAEIMWTKGVIH